MLLNNNQCVLKHLAHANRVVSDDTMLHNKLCDGAQNWLSTGVVLSSGHSTWSYQRLF